MTAVDNVIPRVPKIANGAPKVVAVIASFADLRRALAIHRPPHLFELRLDVMCTIADELERMMTRLPAPIIVTARHPGEGGSNNLSGSQRRELLLRFLPNAAFIDVELRCVSELQPVLKLAARLRVGRIISSHDLRGTPTAARLDQLARSAEAASADVFKIATLTRSRDNLACLDRFFEANKPRIRIALMGFGPLGRISRESFATRSALNYAHLGRAQVDGQLSLAELQLDVQAGDRLTAAAKTGSAVSSLGHVRPSCGAVASNSNA